MPLSEVEEQERKKIFDKNLSTLIHKAFLPQLDGDAPINQVVDLWYLLQIMDKEPLQALPHIKAKDLIIKYLTQQLKVLSDEDSTIKIYFKDLIKLPDNDAEIVTNSYVNLIVRNTIIQFTEQQLLTLKMLAGKKDETTEETIKRLQTNSNK